MIIPWDNFELIFVFFTQIVAKQTKGSRKIWIWVSRIPSRNQEILKEPIELD